MGRTNIVLDDALVQKVMTLYGLRSRREAVDFALRELVGQHERRDMLDMAGTGWDGDLDELRGAGSDAA